MRKAIVGNGRQVVLVEEVSVRRLPSQGAFAEPESLALEPNCVRSYRAYVLPHAPVEAGSVVGYRVPVVLRRQAPAGGRARAVRSRERGRVDLARLRARPRG